LSAKKKSRSNAVTKPPNDWLDYCFGKRDQPCAFMLRSLKISCLAVCAGASLVAFPAYGQQVVTVSSAGALQQALDQVPDGGIIELAAGTYSAPNGGWTIYPDLSGGTRSFTVRAAAGASVVLTGNSNTRILTFTTPKPVTFERLTFSNGLSTEEFHGGAISLSGVQANFIQCTFTNNEADPPTTGGGAVWIDSSTVLFRGCAMNNNTARNYAGAFSAYLSRVYVQGSSFSGNRTNLPGHSSFNGGGVIHGNASTISISNSRFENNQAGYVGGAIYVIGPYGSPTMHLIVSDSLFTGNIAVRDGGGSNPDPTTGGAVFMEDDTDAHFYNCRFTNNTAQQGGAIGGYRTTTEIKNCVLQYNTATGRAQNGESLGGAISVLSDDNPDGPTNGGLINRPSARLTVTDSLIQGQGATVVNARQGGGIFVAGDLHAAYGITVNQNGTPESNHAIVNLKRVVFADLTTIDSAGNGTGGAMTADFVTLNVDSCIIINCLTSQYGGGFELIRGTGATITNTTFTRNTAGVLGGALTMFGGVLNMTACNLTDNKLTNPGGGSALMTSADPGGGQLPAVEMTGAVENCVISNNSGGPATIYDGYRATAPLNWLQYKANKIYPADSTAFFIDSIGSKSVSDVNGMTLRFGDGSTVVKAPVPNIALTAPATIGAILMVPQMAPSSGGPGEALPLPAYLGFASSGGSPSLDGNTPPFAAGVVQTSVNSAHTLTVGGNSYSTTPVPRVALNISTRLPVGTGQQVLIGGFIIQGPNPKTLIIRAIGPSLPLAGVLQDPYLELHDGTGQIIATNDNWRATNLGGILTSNQIIDLGATIPPSNNAESAVIATLAPGAYTAVVRGTNNVTGVAVVEAYDLDPDPASKLVNISTRGFVQTGDDVMIGGFILGGGPGATSVLVRGIGPSLAAFGIANPLADPMLELHDGYGATIDSNDDWRANEAAIRGTGLQPGNDAESALLKTNLPLGAYTVILRGKNGGIGIGVLEAYVY
jgi:hypothetical protein